MAVRLLKGDDWRDTHYLKNEVRRAWQRYVMLSSRWGKPIESELEELKGKLLKSIKDDSYLSVNPDAMKEQIEQISLALPYIRPGRCNK